MIFGVHFSYGESGMVRPGIAALYKAVLRGDSSVE